MNDDAWDRFETSAAATEEIVTEAAKTVAEEDEPKTITHISEEVLQRLDELAGRLYEIEQELADARTERSTLRKELRALVPTPPAGYGSTTIGTGTWNIGLEETYRRYWDQQKLTEHFDAHPGPLPVWCSSTLNVNNAIFNSMPTAEQRAVSSCYTDGLGAPTLTITPENR